jgi:hypothetical protein
MKYVKIKPIILSGPDMSDMTIAHYIDEEKMAYYDAYMNYIGRVHKCNVICNVNTALKFTPKDAKQISNNNTIDFDNSNINLFKSSWGGRGNYLLARAREIIIHNLRPLGLCWVVQEQHLFMDNYERLTGMMLEATIGAPNTIPTTYRLTIKGLNGNMWKHSSTLNYDLSIIDNSSEKDTVTNIKTYANAKEIISTIKELFKVVS